MKILFLIFALIPSIILAEYRTFEYQTSLTKNFQQDALELSEENTVKALKLRFEKQHKKVCYQNRALFVRIETVKLSIEENNSDSKKFTLIASVTCDVIN